MYFMPLHAIVSSNEIISSDPTVIIDAGHGGEDGGAVSVLGEVESTINLEIARKLCHMLDFLGHKTVMTRKDSNAIYDTDAKTLREKKVSDLKNRVALINSISNAFVISIHQNYYPDSKVSGAQVFYNLHDKSELASEFVTESLKCCGISKVRAPAKIGETIYLMNNINSDAILVECGFISNYDECSKLCSDNYQSKIALAVTGGYINYLSME